MLTHYLSQIDERFQLQEKDQLLRLARKAKTYAGRTPPSGAHVERRIKVTGEASVFEFSAPDVPGAMVSVQTSVNVTTSTSWSVVLGAGVGMESTRSVSEKVTFTAGSGETKQVFVPVPAVAVRRYEVIPAPHQPSRWAFEAFLERAGYASPPTFAPVTASGFDEVLPSRLSNLHGPSVRSVDGSPRLSPSLARRLSFLADPGQTVRIWSLSGNRSHDTEVEWSHEGTRDYAILAGGAALGIRVNASVSVRLAANLTLRMILPAGHDYHLRLLTKAPGVNWLVDPIAKRSSNFA
jgi:hypothetical protein